MNYEQKYLKYKKKYLDLRRQIGGASNISSSISNTLKSPEMSNISNDVIQKSEEPLKQIEVIELNNWTIDKKQNYNDNSDYNRMFLKKKLSVLDTCFELKFGPWNSSKIIGEFGNDLEIKNIAEHNIEVYDVKNNKIYKLLKDNACNKLSHSLNFLNDNLLDEFKSNFINKVKSSNSIDNYEKYWS